MSIVHADRDSLHYHLTVTLGMGKNIVEDALYEYFTEQGYSGTLVDMEYQYLREQGYSTWNDFLVSLGFSGNLSDMFHGALTQSRVLTRSWYLNALAISNRGNEPTLSAPDSIIATDYTGAYRNFGGCVNEQGQPTPPIVGSRLATTVADGAVLGEDVWSEAAVTLNGDTTRTGDRQYNILSIGGAASSALLNNQTTEGAEYYVEGIATVNSGSIYVGPSGGVGGQIKTISVSGEFSHQFTGVANNDAVISRAASCDVDVIITSIRGVLPTCLDTDESGNPLQPYTLKNGVKDYEYYPLRVNSTPYLLGDKRSAIASDGTERYYECTAEGTSAASAPTFPTSGTVVDGGVTWTYGGYHTLKGALVLPAITNKATCRKVNPTDLTNLTKIGDAAATLTVVDDSAALAVAGLDGICTSGKVYKLDNSAGTGTAYAQLVGATSNTNPHSLVVYGRRLVGALALLRLHFATTDQQTLSDDGYTRLEINGATPGSTGDVLQIACIAGATAYFILPSLTETTTAPPYPIIGDDTAAAVTQSAVNWSFPTQGVLRSQNCAVMGRVEPTASGQSKYALGSFINTDNRVNIYVGSTAITFLKRVLGTSYSSQVAYTHSRGVPFEYVMYWTDVGIGGRFREVGGTWSAWSTDSNQSEAAVSQTFQLGGQGDTNNHFAAKYSEFKTLFLPAKSSEEEYQAYISEVWGD